MGEAQVAKIARVFANPRCGAQVVDVADSLLTLGELMRYDDFRAKVRGWVRLMDVDGAYREFDRADAGRSAWFQHTDGARRGSVRGGGPAVGEMLEIWRRYCDAKFFTDRDLVERGGIAGTDAQRRFDASATIFRDAATAPASAVGERPVVKLVMSEALFEDLLTESATGSRLAQDPLSCWRSAGRHPRVCRSIRGGCWQPR